MNKWKLCLGLMIALCIVVSGLALANGVLARSQSYTLDWSVVGSGGKTSVQLDSTIGQPAIGWSTGSSRLGSGFWYGIIGANYAVYLPLIARNR